MKQRFWFLILVLFVSPCSIAGVMSEMQERFSSCMGDKWFIPDAISWTSPGKYAHCQGTAFRVIAEKSGISQALESHTWIPPKGMVTVLDKVIVVQFKPDDDMINFFKTRFIGSDARIPMGLEIDISPLGNSVFYKCGSVAGLNTKSLGLFLDTTAFDKYFSCGASAVIDPPVFGKPNFVGKSIKLYDVSGIERYTFKKTEEVKMRGEITNQKKLVIELSPTFNMKIQHVLFEPIPLKLDSILVIYYSPKYTRS